MPRRRIQFQYVQDRNARKASLKKRRTGLLKKVYELCTLCGVSGCIIIYEPDSDIPAIWPPNRAEVDRVIQRFLNTSELERCKRMMDHESYLMDMINKSKHQLMVLEKYNRKAECEILMHQVFSQGRAFDALHSYEAEALVWYMDVKKNEIQKRIQYLQYAGPPGSHGVPSSVQPPNFEVGQSSGENGNSGNESFKQDTQTWMQTLAGGSGSNPNMVQYSAVAGFGNNNFLLPAIAGPYGSVNMPNLAAVGYGNNSVLHQSIPDNSNAYVLPPTAPGYNNGNTLQARGAIGYSDNAVLQGNPNNRNSGNMQRASLESGVGAGTGMANNNMGFIHDPYAITNNSSNNNILLPVPYAGAPIRNAGNYGYPLRNPQQGGTLGYQMGLPQQRGSIGYPVGIQEGGGLLYPTGVHAQGGRRMGYLDALLSQDDIAENAFGIPGGSADLEMGMPAQGGIGNMEHGIWIPRQGYYAGENSTTQVNMNAQNVAIGNPEVGSNNFGWEAAPEGYYPGESSAAAAPVTTSSGANATVNRENEEGMGLYPSNNETSF